MATLGDIGVSALINIIGAFTFLLAFALLRIQPINDRVYFPKWYISGKRTNPRHNGNFVGKFVNLNFMTYFTFLNWMPQALKMSEAQIITHAGLDSAVFLRIYTLGLKIFLPMAIVALVILIPVNVSDGTLFYLHKDLVVSNIDKLSVSNVKPKSIKFFFHIGAAYLFTFWTCFMLYKEYGRVAAMRLKFLASESQRAEQFTVLVRNIPHVSGHAISESVENYFRKNHPDHYLCHQVVYDANKFARLVRRRNRIQNWLDYNQLKFDRHPEKKPTKRNACLGLCGEEVDSIDFYKRQVNAFDRKLTMERQRILKDPKSIMAAAFVSFNSRWGAAVCAQTQQSKHPILWLTNWAPEPRDVYWRNLAIPFFSLNIRRLVISLAVFALVFFYMIPIAFVQSLANLEGLEKVAPFLRPVIELKLIKGFLQGFLPGLALKIFLFALPNILMIMSKIEGHVAKSVLERKTAEKYYYFMLVNVFLGSIITGTAFQQLYAFLHQPPSQIPRNIGVSIPMKATFFITYIMVDGWAGIAGEILRLKPLIIYHLKNLFIVKTERDREKAMNPGGVDFPETIPTLQLYFLLGLVYAVVTPILLPFVLVFFAFAYLVYRHQVINVYNQQYESAAAFWPDVHSRIIRSLLVSQLLLMGLLSTKKAAKATPLLVLLPILTLIFHYYCKHRFEPAFKKYPLEEAMDKDLEDHATQSDVSLKSFLSDAYLHPIFHSFEVLGEEELVEVKVDKTQPNRVPTPPSSASSSPLHEDHHLEDEKQANLHEDHHLEDEKQANVEDQDEKQTNLEEDQQASSTTNTVNHYEVGSPINVYQYEADYSHNVHQYEVAENETYQYHTDETNNYDNFFNYDNDLRYHGYHY